MAKLLSSIYPTGTPGREVELSTNETHIQWKYNTATEWADLIALEDLEGAPGEDGSDANVTNTNVNAAIALDPEATKEALGLNENIIIDADPALAANSDLVVSSQKAVKSYVDAETAARSNADSALSTSISNEVTRATSAETVLSNNISSEATTRSTADTTLTNAINSEASTRATADQTLTDSITAETNSRIAGDALSLLKTSNLSDVANVVTARSNLGLVISTNVQAWSSNLDSWAEKTIPSGTVVGTSDPQVLTSKTLTSPVINVTSDATGDLYYRNAGGAFTRLGIGSTGNVLTVAGGLPSWAAASGGGLTNWTDAISTATPNGTISVSSFTATGAATNIDAVIRAKGNGAILAQVPDNTTVGGNKRGNYAVDLQSSRANAAQVASGGNAATIGGGASNQASGNLSTVAGGSTNLASNAWATVSGGSNNTASGSTSTISGGNANTAGGTYAAVSGGNTNTANGTNAAIGGGANNIASVDFSTVAGGSANNASGYASVIAGGGANVADSSYSSITGGLSAKTRGIYGAEVRASGTFATVGDAQRGSYILRRATTGATQTELSCDGGAPSAATRIVLPNNATYSFRGQLAARSSTGDSAAWRFSGTIERGAAAANTAIIGTVTMTDTQAEAGAAAWALAIDADTTNGSLRLQVTGAAATNIKWLATVDTCELTY